MNVMGWADQQVEEQGEFEALVFRGRRLSNVESHQGSARLASGLLELGLVPGERVVLRMSNSIDLVEVFTATVRAGGVAVILSENAPLAEVERVLEETSARLLFGDGQSEVSGVRTMDVADLRSRAGTSMLLEPVRRRPEDLAQIVYTSGSSGLSRGVGWSHGVIAARYQAFADRRPAGAAPRRSLCVLPLSGSFGAQYLYLRLLQRMTLVIEPRFHPEEALRALRQERIQTAMLVPAMAEALLAYLGGRSAELPSLASLLIGGSTVTPSLVQRLKTALKVRVSSVYGLTELGPVARTEPGDSSGSLGRLGPGVEARLVPVAGETEYGEVQLRAPSFRASCLDNAETDDWLSTGDLGYFDDRGELRLVGRRHERIIRGGVNIYPQPLEEMLRGHPAVVDSAIVGVDDPYLGEEVVAWVVSRDSSLGEEDLLSWVRAQVEASRAPVRVFFRGAIPRNEGGKTESAMLRREAVERINEVRETSFSRLWRRTASARRPALLRQAIWDRLRFLLGEVENVPERPFGELGLDSLGAVRLANSLSEVLGCPLPSTLTFEHPTVAALARHLNELLSGASSRPLVQVQSGRQAWHQSSHEVAIVGAGCRLSGEVDSVEELWRLLREGRCTVGPIERWNMRRHQDARSGAARGKSVTTHAALLDRDRFDASFFSLNAAEARAMDPQHRLALEVSWQALESAGYAPCSLADRSCGVFLGISQPPARRGVDPIGSMPSMGVGRISHLLDLHGPTLALDTACSSGLVAVHSAVQSLRLGQCDLALAGAVNVIASAESFVALSKLGVLAPDGLCKAFDVSADGFGRGEGCVMLVLKRLQQARQDGDSILAVIAGSAVNHDGRSSSLTAPHGPSQEAVARLALAEAGWRGEDVDYLEAHGSGTPLGDPIELEAAVAVYGGGERPLLVGSAKSNFGHLEAAAGALGLLKAALVAHHKEVPPHLHFRQWHPGLRRVAERVRIPTELTSLARPCRVAVTSLGMGGTNAVMMVQSPPASESQADGEPPELDSVLCLSARTLPALEALTERYDRALGEVAASAVDIAHTSSVGREHFAYRRAVVGSTPAALRRALRSAYPPPPTGSPRLAFLFSGQGSHWAEAGTELLEQEPVFRDAMERCAECLGETPRSLLALSRPEMGQAALFALEWSLAKLWSSWGIEPEWVLGHSLGEYVAACLAGVFELEDGLRLVSARGALMTALGGGGGMLSANLGADQVSSQLQDLPLDLAALNGPTSTVVSGPLEHLRAFGAGLEKNGYAWRMLDVPTAFHSRLIEPMMEAFHQVLAGIELRSPRLEVVSTVSGGVLTAYEACSPDFWRAGLRSPVRFAEAIAMLASRGATRFLEIGPHPVLSTLGPACLTRSDLRWTFSLRRGTPGRRALMEGLAHLYEGQLDPDWSAVHSVSPRRRVGLPTYPFSLAGRPDRPSKTAGRVEDLVEAILGQAVGAEDNLLERGLDSLRMMQLLSDLERVTGRRLSPASLLEHPTVSGLIRQLAAEGASSPLIALNDASRGKGLVCLHPAGGHIGVYLPLLELIPEEWSLYAMQARGLLDIAQEPTSLKEMVRAYATSISLARPEGELVLMGWSFGAALAHAVAGTLEDEGREVARVIMVDPPRAGFKADLAASWFAALATYVARPPQAAVLRKALNQVPSSPRGLAEDLHRLSVQRGWLPAEAVQAGAFQAQVRLHQHHAALLRELEPQTICAPVFLYWARRPSDPGVWDGLSRAEVRQTALGGNHYSVMRGPRLSRVLDLALRS